MIRSAYGLCMHQQSAQPLIKTTKVMMRIKRAPKPEITLSVFLNLHFSVLPGRRWRRHRGQSPVGRRGWCPPSLDFLLSICHFSMNMILVHFLSESSFSPFKVLRFLSHWLSWGNFVRRRRVFSGQGAVFLFSSFAKLLLIFWKTRKLRPKLDCARFLFS